MILSKFGGNIHVLWVTTSCLGYVLFMFTHRARVWMRACATARTCVHLLIFGCILSKFGGNILWVTTRCLGYVLFMFRHRARVCVLTARSCVRSLIFGRILSKLGGNILRVTTRYMGYSFFLFTHHTLACMRAHANAARMCVFAYLWTYSLKIWWEHTYRSAN